MAKLKITVSGPIEIDVEFPFYTKISEHVFLKFIHESNGFFYGVRVENYPNSSGNFFGIGHGLIPSSYAAEKQITKEEFELEFKKVQDKINQLVYNEKHI